MKKLDSKFHGLLVKNKDQSIVPQDEWVVFLAKDNAFPPTLQFYLDECKRQGATMDQLMAIRNLIARVEAWRDEFPGACHTPDVHRGELAE